MAEQVLPAIAPFPTQEILRKAPLVSSPKDQFDTAVVDQVSTLTQTRSHQNTLSTLYTLVLSKAPRPIHRPSWFVCRSRPWWRTQPWTKRRHAPSKPSFPEKARPKSTDFTLACSWS